MKSIFIVEDDNDLRDIYEKVLAMNGFVIKPSASNGKEAIRMFKEFSPKPDIMIIDYQMPVLNGIDAIKEIMKINNGTEIIMISSYPKVEEKAHKLGIKFLAKTGSIFGLVKGIKSIMDDSTELS